MGYIDLHLHLDGAVTPDIARQLAVLQEIKLPEEDEDLRKLLMVPASCESLNDFLKCFELPLSLLQTREGLTEAVRLVSDKLISDGVEYAELRFAPQLHKDKGMSQEDAVIAALTGLEKTGLHANLILCCMRGNGNETENYETLELAHKYLTDDGGVVAIDLAGAEALFPTSDYRELFKKAADYNIPFTIHAGEADGSESIRLAVEYGARRIGHGVRAFEDMKVVELLRDKGVTLELCPTSNRMTRAFTDIRTYPLRRFMKAGVKVTLNTDDPGIEGITLADEYDLMREEIGLTKEEEDILHGNALNAAFCTKK